MTASRVPPQSADAERAVLGGVLLDNSARDLPLVAEDFYADANQRIWGAMQALFRVGQPVDTTTLREALARSGELQSVGGDEYLLALTNTIPTLANIEAHAKIVRNLASVRRLILACHEVAARGYGKIANVEQYLDEAESLLFEATQKRDDEIAFSTMDQVITESYEGMVARSSMPSRLLGQPTGITKLDRMTSGLCAGDFIVIAGRPGMGKTTFAMGIAQATTVNDRRPVLVFSLEMAKKQLGDRVLASEAPVDLRKVRTCEFMTREHWDALSRAAERVSKWNIHVSDKPGVVVQTVFRAARRVAARSGGLAMIVIDYLQLMHAAGKFQSREQEVAEMSRQCKIGARELGCPVVALSQLNRGGEARGSKDKRPQLADLRESGAIEQDADTIMFVYRDELYHADTQDKGIAEIIVGKQRQGPTGTVRVKFDAEFTRFRDLEEQAAPPTHWSES
jgi:replicative DNA helicase